MSKLVFTMGAALIFSSGFYFGNQHYQHSPPMELARSTEHPDEKLARFHTAPKRNNSTAHTLINERPKAPPVVPQPPILETAPSINSPPLSPADIARQDNMNAEMIASMRANHLPEAHIIRMEQLLAARRAEAIAPYEAEPAEPEKSPEEFDAETKASLTQAGAPPEIIDDMISHQQPAEPAAEPAESPQPPHTQVSD